MSSALFSLWIAASALHFPAADSLAAVLRSQAPGVDARVLAMALSARQCAITANPQTSPVLVVIDYSKPSTEPRLWVFDVEKRKLLFKELVAHGKNSGENATERFSDKPGSLMTSLGVFLTSDTYQGRNGYSLRLLGLEPGFNGRSLERAIVMHGADYVSDRSARALGRLGRSWGCPAVRRDIARQLIDTVKNGAVLFSYYPDPSWLKSSRYLQGCPAPRS
jgi:hypothetical protein